MSVSRLAFLFPLFTSLFSLANFANAHVYLKNNKASVGEDYQAVFVVPHGCGASATVGLRVQVPEGVNNVQAQAPVGWQLNVVEDEAAGSDAQTRVKEVAWRGGVLPSDETGEFVFSATLSQSLKANSILYFPAIQECEDGLIRWIDRPGAGQSEDDLDTPAPALHL